MLVLLVIFALLGRNLARSRTGRAFAAIRDRDIAAAVIGVNLTRYKVIAFAVSSFYAGVAGALLYVIPQTFTAGNFNLLMSVQFIAMILIGGAATISGSIMGALFITLLPRITSELPAVLPFISTSATGGGITVVPGRVDPVRAADHRVPVVRAERACSAYGSASATTGRRGRSRTECDRKVRRHMTIRRSMVAALAVPLAVALAVAGCRAQESATPQTGKEGTKVDFGVTNEPCPQAIDTSKGCIYLGTISDLTEGPFKALAVPITDAQKAFWRRVNEQGGIGGYEIDVTTYVKDNKYNPQIHNQVYQEIKPNILALAQTLGSPHHRGHPAGPEGQQPRRGTGLVDLLVGLRGRGGRVGHELLHRVDELGRLRGRQAGRQERDGRAPGRRLRRRRRGRRQGRRGEAGAEVHRRQNGDRAGQSGRRDRCDRVRQPRRGHPDQRPNRRGRDHRPGERPRVQGQVHRHQPDLEPRPAEGPGRGRDHVAVPAVRRRCSRTARTLLATRRCGRRSATCRSPTRGTPRAGCCRTR